MKPAKLEARSTSPVKCFEATLPLNIHTYDETLAQLLTDIIRVFILGSLISICKLFSHIAPLSASIQPLRAHALQ